MVEILGEVVKGFFASGLKLIKTNMCLNKE
jgi:hypothetical protein